ncbi:GntR family transcriptional regulator [Nakamurella silvestris]|nr:GntR family transcriptional regulator [Nakamurella silvestris]
MSPQITVDLRSAIPVYEQIRGQLAGHIAAGELAGGARLPTVRALAADLGVAVNTVGRAYSELESAGLVASRRKLGTVVLGGGIVTVSADLQNRIDGLASQSLSAGLSEESLVELLRAALRRAGAAAS